MAFKTIYISNVLESFYRSYDQLPPDEKKGWFEYDFLEANRALLYGADDKVVVTSYPINPEHQKYVCGIMDWQNVLNLYPEKPTPSISQDLGEGQLGVELIKIIQENPGIELVQYRSTGDFHNLVAKLRRKGLRFNTPELISDKDEFIVNYYNTKRGFRHLWSGVLGLKREGINIPEGFITGNVEEALDAAWWFRSHNRSFVVKYNRGVQGMGIVLNRYMEFSENKQQFLEQLKLKLSESIWAEPAVVVEELIEPDPQNLGGSPNVEFMIKADGKVEFSYPCEQILEDGKKFIGVYIHPELIKRPQMLSAREAGERFGEALSRQGYRGCFDVDMVIDKQGQAYAVEANLRRTGGTHAHEAALALLGKDYWQKHHVYILDLKLKEPLDYAKFKELTFDLWLKQKGSEGLFLANPDLMTVKVLVPIIIANSSEKVRQLETELKKRLQGILL